jgi:putative aldouronate transport system substrate-binding protein
VIVSMVSGGILLLSAMYLTQREDPMVPLPAPTGVPAYQIIDGIPRYDPPITLTQNYILSSTGENLFAPGHDIDNNTYVHWSRDTMGIIWKPKWIAHDFESDKQKMNYAIASRNLPNVIKRPASEIINMAKLGLIHPLDDLIEKHASPLLKYLLAEANQSVDGKLFEATTYQGKIYAMPTILDKWAGSNNTHWIRNDLLDQLEAGMPLTIAAYEKVMARYKAVYPSKYPHYMQVINDHKIQGMEVVANALGSFPHAWLKNDNNTLMYGSIQPETKQALSKLRQWYTSGWIDPEFTLKKENQDFIMGNALSLYGPWWYVHSVFLDTVKRVPQAKIYPVPLFVENRKSSFIVNFPFGEGIAITKGTHHPEAVILQFNEYVESLFRSHEDLRQKFAFKYDNEPLGLLDGYKREGPQYFNFPNANNINETDSVHLIFGMRINQRVTQLYDTYARIYETMKKGEQIRSGSPDWFEYSALVERKNIEGHNLNIELYQQQEKQGLYDKYDEFFGAPTDTMLQKGAYLKKMEKDVFVNIIKGNVPLEAFDQFVEDWYANGGQEMTKEVNDWYQRK